MVANELIDDGEYVSVSPNGDAFELIGEDKAFAIGRLVGMALLKGVIFPLYFTLPAYKLLLGQELELEDLKHVDSEMYYTLVKFK
jgi:hypothetical protein